MGTTMIQKNTHYMPRGTAEEGFTLLEVMIAIVVMVVGLLAVIASFATAIQATQSAEEDLIARQKVMEAMESIYTARNAQQIPFGAIANVAQGGIFLDGPQPLKCAGNDGLVNTADDVVCTTQAGANCPGVGAECMVIPGPDGTLGTADDVTMSLGNFTRTVAITPVLLPSGVVNNNMAAIAITVTYTKDGWPPRTFTANGLISSYH